MIGVIKNGKLIFLIICMASLLWLVFASGCTPFEIESVPEAAVIDQLFTFFPNQAFTEKATQELEKSGFQVSIIRHDAITVGFYKRLPSYGYKVIILRVHSGLLGVDPRVINKTWLYTNEPYSKTAYIAEQLDDRVTYARTLDNAPWCFAIGAKFIEESMDGFFDNTVIIMMGCDSLHLADIAQAFIIRGASLCIGWDASVLLNYVDDATCTLLEDLSHGFTVQEAVARTMSEKGPDPKYRSILRYFPAQNARKTLKQLIK